MAVAGRALFRTSYRVGSVRGPGSLPYAPAPFCISLDPAPHKCHPGSALSVSGRLRQAVIHHAVLAPEMQLPISVGLTTKRNAGFVLIVAEDIADEDVTVACG